MACKRSPKKGSNFPKQAMDFSINSAPSLNGFNAGLPEVSTSISQGCKLGSAKAFLRASACFAKTGTTVFSIAS